MKKIFYSAAPGDSPSNIMGTALNSTHVYLMWNPPPSDQINGIIQGHQISVTELETGDIFQYTTSYNETTIGDLHPHYNYNFSIAAFTIAGYGPTTSVVVRTAEAGILNLFNIITIYTIYIFVKLTIFSFYSTIECPC